jgi:hypothetical protein
MLHVTCSLFKFMVVERRADAVPFRSETLMLLVRLCGRLGDRTLDVLARGKDHALEVGGAATREGSSRPRKLYREHRLLESRSDFDFAADFAVQLWLRLEKMATSRGEPHPSQRAHEVRARARVCVCVEGGGEGVTVRFFSLITRAHCTQSFHSLVSHSPRRPPSPRSCWRRRVTAVTQLSWLTCTRSW